MTKPFFFVFDGVDGAGKTTQITRFQAWLEGRGHSVITCRDPGSSELGETVRELLLNSTSLAIGNRAEMLLYMAARAQLVDQIVRPALDNGDTVISDRYLLANVVYQGHAGGLPPEDVWRIGVVATGGLEPTLTIVLDLDPQIAASRRHGPPDRLERRSHAYFEKVRGGFVSEAQQHPESIAVVDASQDPGAVQQAVQDAAIRAMAYAKDKS